MSQYLKAMEANWKANSRYQISDYDSKTRVLALWNQTALVYGKIHYLKKGCVYDLPTDVVQTKLLWDEVRLVLKSENVEAEVL
jgi:hypothetical protein